MKSNNTTTNAAAAAAAAPAPTTSENEKALDEIQSRIAHLEMTRKQEEEEDRQMHAANSKGTKEIQKIAAGAATPEEKVERLLAEYIELLNKANRLERDCTRSTRKCDAAVREKDTAILEASKAMSMKSKLENLCRELQKENKRIKEESMRLAEGEQAKREELSNKFQMAIEEIKTKMMEGDEKLKKVQDSEQLKEQMRNLMEQYNLREQHFNSILKSKDLELQLSQAKYEQQKEIAEAESVRAQISMKKEAEMKQQLNLYVSKFEQVQDAINQSNEVFNTFKREMESMSKKLKKIEKENETLREKNTTLNINILGMVDERTTLQKQKTRLETLCRALQDVNKELRLKLEKYEEVDGSNISSATSLTPSQENQEKVLLSISLKNEKIKEILENVAMLATIENYEVIGLTENENCRLYAFSKGPSHSYSAEEELTVVSQNLVKGDSVLALQVEVKNSLGFLPIACKKGLETQPIEYLAHHDLVELPTPISFTCKVNTIISNSEESTSLF